MKDKLDPGSLAIIAITLILFVVALFTKGLTHDILLEAGVFLISVKLIMLAYKNNQANQVLLGEIQDLKKHLKGAAKS